jgi:hypothetical protein
MHKPALTAAVLLSLATVAAAELRTPYSAHDTLRRAQVGTFAPPSPAREPAAPATAPRFDRLECREDPSRPLEKAVVCVPITGKVK